MALSNLNHPWVALERHCEEGLLAYYQHYIPWYDDGCNCGEGGDDRNGGVCYYHLQKEDSVGLRDPAIFVPCSQREQKAYLGSVTKYRKFYPDVINRINIYRSEIQKYIFLAFTYSMETREYCIK